jgi:hypothetical protein
MFHTTSSPSAPPIILASAPWRPKQEFSESFLALHLPCSGLGEALQRHIEGWFAGIGVRKYFKIRA